VALSKVSIWLGPPVIHNRITLFFRGAGQPGDAKFEQIATAEKQPFPSVGMKIAEYVGVSVWHTAAIPFGGKRKCTTRRIFTGVT